MRMETGLDRDSSGTGILRGREREWQGRRGEVELGDWELGR